MEWWPLGISDCSRILVENDLWFVITLRERERERERDAFGVKATLSWYVKCSQLAYNFLPALSSPLKSSKHQLNTQSTRFEMTNFIIDA
jgi:hypothetical protein